MNKGIAAAIARIKDTSQLKVLNTLKNPMIIVIISSTAGSMLAVAVVPFWNRYITYIKTPSIKMKNILYNKK